MHHNKNQPPAISSRRLRRLGPWRARLLCGVHAKGVSRDGSLRSIPWDTPPLFRRTCTHSHSAALRGLRACSAVWEPELLIA